MVMCGSASGHHNTRIYRIIWYKKGGTLNYRQACMCGLGGGVLLRSTLLYKFNQVNQLLLVFRVNYIAREFSDTRMSVLIMDKSREKTLSFISTISDEKDGEWICMYVCMYVASVTFYLELHGAITVFFTDDDVA